MMQSRRAFITHAAAAAAAGVVAPSFAAAKAKPLYGMLLHLGRNMWCDKPCPRPVDEKGKYTPPQKALDKWGAIHREGVRSSGKADFLRFDETCWRYTTGRMRDLGMNFVMIDLGEGVVYPSHPELAVKGSWTPDKLCAELKRLREMGLEPIPKLNFSTTHDAWLGDYERMVSTQKYYGVVSDLIKDVCELFDRPRFFHLGYDEEDYDHQWNHLYVAVRQGELWWHDCLYTIREVEKHGVRAWIWSDKIWKHRDKFCKRMPKTVLQSNWYYLGDFDPSEKSELYPMVHAYDWLEEGGYDQVPCCSSCGDWRVRDYNNPLLTLQYCRDKARVKPERLKGLMMAPWCQTRDFTRPYFDDAFDLMPPAKKLMDEWLG